LKSVTTIIDTIETPELGVIVPYEEPADREEDPTETVVKVVKRRPKGQAKRDSEARHYIEDIQFMKMRNISLEDL